MKQTKWVVMIKNDFKYAKEIEFYGIESQVHRLYFFNKFFRKIIPKSIFVF